MIQTRERATAAGTDWRAEFERFEEALPGGRPAWLGALRRGAIEEFARRGYPSGREEDWRTTNVAPLAKRAFATAPRLPARLAAGDLEALLPIAPSGCARLVVFVDGRLVPELSRLRGAGTPGPNGIEVLGLAQALRDAPDALQGALGSVVGTSERPFEALNTAFFEDVAFVRIAAGAGPSEPIVILHVHPGLGAPDTPASSGVANGGRTSAAFPRTLVLAGESSTSTVVEVHASSGADPRLSAPVTELVLGPGARLRTLRIEREGPGSFHLGATGAALARDADLQSFVLAAGTGLARHDLAVSFRGPGAGCSLSGLYLADGTRSAECRTFVDHAVPHCTSRQSYRGVLAGRSRAAFNGRVLVREDAQGTDARQSNRNLLLSSEAHADSKPQLEIHADDVRCSHGATLGQLDGDALFYMRSRGLARDEARRILTRAFAAHVLEEIAHEELRAAAGVLLDSRLAAALEEDPSER